MAFLEQSGEVTAVNELARTLLGTGDGIRVATLFPGGLPAEGAASRQRFDCLLQVPHGLPLQVSAATQPFHEGGEGARLILVMEPVAANESNSKTLYLQDLFDSSPEATIILHGDNRILRANRQFRRMFGFTLDECIGQDPHNLIIPDGHHHESEILTYALATAGRGSIDSVRRTRSGELLDVTISVGHVQLGPDENGRSVTYHDIRSQRRTEARLQHSALHDPLTGLANRVLFLDRLNLTMARLIRRPDRNFAVVFLDVDRFKQVNDVHGHAAGDALLLSITASLKSSLRPQDTIARFGGDEFALLLDEVGSPEEIRRLAERIQSAVQRPVDVGGVEAFVSASMGIALGSVEYINADDIMRDADKAMYRAKANGKARHEFFEGTPNSAC